MRKIVLTTTIVMLAAASGQAFAYSAVQQEPRRQQAAVVQRASDPFNAFGQMMPSAEPDAHQYHGGPKTND